MPTPINIFIIYAREDINIKQRLLLHLNPFKTVFNAVIWHDGNIEAGQEWKPHIDSRLEQTDLFILLVSIDFMNSEFINQVEFKYAIERHNKKKSTVIPVIINYCQWDIDIPVNDYTFNLNKLQVLPSEGKPIDDWKTPEQAYNNIAAGIRTVLSSIKSQREQGQREKEKFELEKETREKEEQLKIEQERFNIENEVQIKDDQETEVIKIKSENEPTAISTDSSFPASRKKKIIIGVIIGVVSLSIFLLINSIWSNKEKSTKEAAGISSISQDSLSISPKADDSTPIFQEPKIVKDEEIKKRPPEQKKLTDTNVAAQEGIKGKNKVDEDKIFVKVETEASFKGGNEAWIKYLQKNLETNAPIDNGAPTGTYTVIVRFMVDKNGYISDVNATTNHGFGMEDEAVRFIKKSPLWIPGTQNGRYVNSYRIQPITFKLDK